MTGQEYDAGTVAMVTAANRREPYRAFFDGRAWVEHGAANMLVVSPLTVRPLVVLDLSKHEWLPQRLRLDGDRVSGFTGVEMHRLADQIEAQTKSPKPAEPTGLGAVVEDARGTRWVRFESDGPHRWHGAHNPTSWFTWVELDVVKVLSEGVTR